LQVKIVFSFQFIVFSFQSEILDTGFKVRGARKIVVSLIQKYGDEKLNFPVDQLAGLPIIKVQDSRYELQGESSFKLKWVTS